jgi:protein-tyrosine phosphatase
VTAVVNLRAEFDDEAAAIAPAHYLHLPTPDDTAPALEQLQRGAVYIAEEVANGGSVYVHCGSGVGRAATMAAAYLVHTGLTPDQAWVCIRQARPFVRPSAVQIEQIEHFAAQPGSG